MDNKFKLIIDSFGRDRFKFDEPIKDYTASGAGGPVKLFFIAFSKQELIKIISMCKSLRLPYFLFGTGSKIMISDEGFDGLVIKNRTKNIEVLSIKGKATRVGIGLEEATVEVESGVSIGKFVEFLTLQGLSSAEFANMPGSIGGNLFISAVLQSKVKSIKVLDLGEEIEEISVSELRLKKHIILSAVFRLRAKS